jgi:hypothetical protein
MTNDHATDSWLIPCQSVTAPYKGYDGVSSEGRRRRLGLVGGAEAGDKGGGYSTAVFDFDADRFCPFADFS